MPAKLESETEQAFYSLPRAKLKAVKGHVQGKFRTGQGRER